jgi:hypothetical protein
MESTRRVAPARSAPARIVVTGANGGWNSVGASRKRLGRFALYLSIGVNL